MKKTITKLFLIIIAILLFSTDASATMMTVKLLDGVTSTGLGTIFRSRMGLSTWVCDIETTGGPSAVTVRINGNQGGSNFSPDGMAEITMDAAELSADFASKTINSGPVLQIRGNLITLTGGTNPTVSVTCTGVDR